RSDAAQAVIQLFVKYPQAFAVLKSAMEDLVRAQDKGGMSPVEGTPPVQAFRRIEGLPAGSSIMQRHVVVPIMYGTDRGLVGNRYSEIPNDGTLKLGYA